MNVGSPFPSKKLSFEPNTVIFPQFTSQTTFEFNETFYIFFAPYYIISIVFTVLLGIAIYIINKKYLVYHENISNYFYKILALSRFIYSLENYQLEKIGIDSNTSNYKKKYYTVTFLLSLLTTLSIIILIIFSVSLLHNIKGLNLSVLTSVLPTPELK